MTNLLFTLLIITGQVTTCVETNWREEVSSPYWDRALPFWSQTNFYFLTTEQTAVSSDGSEEGVVFIEPQTLTPTTKTRTGKVERVHRLTFPWRGEQRTVEDREHLRDLSQTGTTTEGWDWGPVETQEWSDVTATLTNTCRERKEHQ